jgi:Flp pilus assembly protein TadG
MFPRQTQRIAIPRNESGSTVIMLTIFIVVLFGFVALSLDVGNVLREQRNANNATDAAALAAALLLPVSGSDASGMDSVKNQAVAFANTNGVKTTEIQASNAGTIELGIWVNRQFLANVMTNGVYNAVRVPAKRLVPLPFGKVVGFDAMNPVVHSVAFRLGSGGIGLRPVAMAVSLANLTGAGFGSSITLGPSDNGVGPGKWSKLDLSSFHDPVPKNYSWSNDMTTNGCNCSVPVGPVSGITGFGGNEMKNTFSDLWNSGSPLANPPVYATFAIPVLDDFGYGGNSSAGKIVGFVAVELINYGGSGNNWSATVRLLDLSNRVTGTGGTCPNPPCLGGSDRALVE